MVGLTCVGIRLGLFSWRPETERRIQKEEWGSEWESELGERRASTGNETGAWKVGSRKQVVRRSIVAHGWYVVRGM